MKNPLTPTYRERERALDKFEMEHNADLQMMLPDFDERLRAHEEKHDPLHEFTKDSLSATVQVTATVTADLTVGLAGVTATAEAGDFERGKKSWITEGELQALIELSKPKLPPEPVPQLQDAEQFTQWLADPRDRKKSLKRIADEDVELQVLAAEGRTALIAWRKAHLWGWLITLFVAHYVLPMIKVIRKWLAPILTLIVWLTTWP